MKQVIGISETVFDILFRDGRPIAGVPGGSVFNGMMTLGRVGVKGCVISEAGDDRIGSIVTGFMESNGISSEYVARFPGTKSAISLAFLDENNDAHYSFYKDYPNNRLEFRYPSVNEGDVVMFGSYYALNPVLRPQVGAFLRYAKEHGAILYYDLNFRHNHSGEKESLMSTIQENFALADIVRGSADDFRILYGETDPDVIWENHIRQYCDSFILTQGADGVALRTGSLRSFRPSQKIETVSTIGAGDNFNAGIIYGIVRHDLSRDDISLLSQEMWDRLIGYGIDFGSNVCQSTDNYISMDFARKYRL